MLMHQEQICATNKREPFRRTHDAHVSPSISALSHLVASRFAVDVEICIPPSATRASRWVAFGPTKQPPLDG